MSSFDKNNLQGAILGMCNPLLDISAEVPHELLDQYGVQLNNAVLAEEKHLPLYKELVEKYPVQYIAGGATQNSIRVAQWMLQVPGSTSFFGAIGNDAYGETLERCAHEDGVNVLYQKIADTPTGTCAVLIHGGERSLVANLAAANKFTAAHLDRPECKKAIEQAQIAYISGFFLTVSVDSILRVAQHCAENNRIFAMNLSAPFLIQFFRDQMEAVMPYADFVFANESEAAAYGAAYDYGSDLPTIALKLAAQPKKSGTFPRVVVFTQGSQATIVAANGEVVSYPVDPLPAEKLVDTNGAGDAFVGGFLSQLVQKKDLKECVRAGHYASRVIIQRSGCTFPKECDFY